VSHFGNCSSRLFTHIFGFILFAHTANSGEEISDKENVDGERPRRRFRDISRHKRGIQKALVEKGLAHTTKSGKQIPSKMFKHQLVCGCKKNVPRKLTLFGKKNIFDAYYNINCPIGQIKHCFFEAL
jgi:hypothetical protein